MGTKFQKLVGNKFLFRLYLLKSLPMAYIAGIRVKELSSEKAVTTIRYKWLTQNPFRSMYFACQAMAAEMSTALPVIDAIYESKPAISMLIVRNEAKYFKKVTGRVDFVCTFGKSIAEAVEKTRQSGEGVEISLVSIGTDETGEKVAEFSFTWSIKIKSK